MWANMTMKYYPATTGKCRCLSRTRKGTNNCKKGLTDEEAMLVVTETNLIQRSFAELSHSEKAKILTVRHKAIKEQGQKQT